jgi:hypothetical protein
MGIIKMPNFRRKSLLLYIVSLGFERWKLAGDGININTWVDKYSALVMSFTKYGQK